MKLKTKYNVVDNLNINSQCYTHEKTLKFC